MKINKIKNGEVSFDTVRKFLIEEKPETHPFECAECKILPIWNGLSLKLQLDHIDGNRKNNLLTNLRWLCPNCHSQTPNWGVKNVSLDGRARMKLGASIRFNKIGLS